ncbi:MAG TPA: ribonuclease HII [Nanoarchaeota archaeon]|nr:ribonuclease HII [Candidatus Woesearchaeota archaeon]HIH14645.1 ribonuclease HII [Nanoarchaeota archaeon]HIH59167.1 ribonuclease HII [Nanoarchaeota archaeon]HII14155.1 ribonuclease HII [Nanoarchaeota archaeon]HIJ05606.1 ribonuclease HII [Nanoarchaeota archaeon]
MCGVVVEEEDLAKLAEIGVKDSKLLTTKKREALFEPIKKIVKAYKLIIIEPQEIDDAVNSDTTNLNFLEAMKTALILNELKPDKAIVDCPSNNIPAYKEYLQNLLTVKMELVLEHNAEKHLQVAAASILAKVTRDRIIVDLEKKYGEMGSGYPADPVTQAFLKKNAKKYPEIFRKSWATYKKIAQQSITDY